MYLVVGFIIGACIVTLAPANFSRFSGEQGDTFNLKQILLQIVRVLLSLRIFLVVAIILFIKLIRNYNNTCKSLIGNKIIILIIACVVNILFAAIIAMNGKHQLVCVELFSIIVLILNVDYIVARTKASEIIILICCFLISIFIYVPIYDYRREYYSAHQILLEDERYFSIVKQQYQKLLPYLNFLLSSGIDEYACQIHDSVNMDMKRWNYAGVQAGHYYTFDNNIGFLKYFIAQRIKCLNEWFGITDSSLEDINLSNGEMHQFIVNIGNERYYYNILDGECIELDMIP